MSTTGAAAASLSDGELADRLDALLVECMQLHQQLGELRQEMTPTLREGWLQISQAQFVVGRSGVCSDSYNLDAPAVTKVVAREGGDVSPGAPEHRFWALDTNLFDAKDDAAAPQHGGNTASSDAGGLRSSGSTGSGGGSSTAGKGALKPPANPVQWFGGAKSPPLELRKAQGCFQRALVVALQLANVQLAFRAASDEYELLQAEKKRRGL